MEILLMVALACGYLAILLTCSMVLVGPIALARLLRPSERWWRQSRSNAASEALQRTEGGAPVGTLRELRAWTFTLVAPGLVGGTALLIFGVGIVLVLGSWVAISTANGAYRGKPHESNAAVLPLAYAILASAGILILIAKGTWFDFETNLAVLWSLVFIPWLAASIIVGWQLMIANELARSTADASVAPAAMA